MRYPEAIVAPMKEELTNVGFEDLTTPEQVDDVIKNTKGTLMIVINSVCGCAAGNMRPGVIESLANDKVPDRLVTVFAGFDNEATARAREYFLSYPPSSPSIALFKDGELVHFTERHHIEGTSAYEVADHLKEAYNEFC